MIPEMSGKVNFLLVIIKVILCLLQKANILEKEVSI